MQVAAIILFAVVACTGPTQSREVKPAYVAGDVTIHTSARPATGLARQVADDKFVAGGFRVDTATGQVGVPFAEPIIAATLRIGRQANEA